MAVSYSWLQLTYASLDWLHIGLAAQRTKVYQRVLTRSVGYSSGLSHKKGRFITYMFNLGWSDPTVVLELGWSF